MNGTGDSDEVVRAVTARLPSGVAVKVEAVTDGASADGMTSVGLRHFDLADALDSVGEIGALVVSKLKKAKPSKTTVELKLGFAVEAGKLTALWVGGKGEAALTVTLEWSGSPDGEAGIGKTRAEEANADDGIESSGGSGSGDGPAAGNADG
jgi:Trypsin-co-occurring domain 1